MVISNLKQNEQSSQVKPSKKAKSKASLVRRWAKRTKWLKFSGGYVHYMHYYFLEQGQRYKTEAEVEALIERLRYCQHTWQQESKGDQTRYRGIGCGDRDNDPLCGSYAQIILSREAARQMLLAQDALDIGYGLKFEHYGHKVVLTLHKEVSQRIDALLFAGDERAWRSEVDKLYKTGAEWAKAWFAGVPFVMSLDLAGESAPSEPHYHLNIYFFPAQLEVEAKKVKQLIVRHGVKKLRNVSKGYSVSSKATPRLFSEGELEAMRLWWRNAQNDAFGLELAEADINIGYLSTEAQLFHWLRYLYRHGLSDIWRGWRGYDPDAGIITYSYSKRQVGKRVETRLEIPKEQLAKAFQRLELIPKHFKCIRWYGSMSDGKRGELMALLGLERIEINDDGEDGRWQPEGYFSFVRFESDGVVLEPRDDHGEGTGQYLKVLDDSLSYSPKGVKVGRRIVWLEPGSRASPKTSNA